MTTTRPLASELLTRVRQRGYRHVLMHPEGSASARILTTDDRWRTIESAQVRVRPYANYPQLSCTREHDLDWIEGGGRSRTSLDYRRFSRAGTFDHYLFVGEDRLLSPADEEGIRANPKDHAADERTLNVYNTLSTGTEALRFAAGPAYHGVPEPTALISIELHRMKGRRLTAPYDEALPPGLVSHQARICSESRIMPTLLLATAADVAVDATLSLLKAFGWRPERRHLDERQARFLKRRL